MSAPYFKAKDASIGAKPVAYTNGDPIPATLWDSVMSLQGDQSAFASTLTSLQSDQSALASGLTQLTRQQQFYQATNGASSTVNDEPQSGESHNQAMQTGLSSDASNWTRFDSWYTPNSFPPGTTFGLDADDIQIATNTDTTMFEPVLGYGVKCKVAGHYKISCNMLFQALIKDVAVAVRFARNGINNDLSPGVNIYKFENPVVVGVSAYHQYGLGGGRQTSSVSISEIINCAENDILSVYTSRAGVGGTVKARYMTCQLRVEYKGPLNL